LPPHPGILPQRGKENTVAAYPIVVFPKGKCRHAEEETMELIQSLHHGLGDFVYFLKFILESVSAICVAIGLMSSLVKAFRLVRAAGNFLQNLPAIRVQFGSWLALALEFQLAADIVATTINPTWQSLGELGLLALIRTFLNFFLQKELAEQERLVKAVLELEPLPVAHSSPWPSSLKEHGEKTAGV
jgi:uncharacterized membrane protein